MDRIYYDKGKKFDSDGKESDLWKLEVLWIRGKRDSLVGNVN